VQTNPRQARRRINIVVIDTDSRRSGLGAIIGLLTAAIAIGVAQLVAGIVGASSSPVVAVQEVAVGLTPPSLKNFAISTFGSNDKLVLLCGVLVVLALFAALIGIEAMRRLDFGLAGLLIFAVIGILAAVTRPHASPATVLPTLIGAGAGAGTLVLLVRAAQPAGAKPAGGKPAGGKPAGAKPASARPARAPAASAPALAGPERRRFMVISAAAAGTAAVTGFGGRLLSERTSVTQAQKSLRIPPPAVPAPPPPAGANLPIPGLSPFITPNGTFYRVDTAIVLPEVAPASWQLRIHGMVSRELSLTFNELIRRPLSEDYITLTCVSNPVAGPYIGNARWLGASLASLLRQAGVRAGADQLLCTSADGFTSGTPLATAVDGRDAMLAVAMNGSVLPVVHGFPVRMVIPGLYGYVSACKWITDIEVTTFAANSAYWAQRGWDQQAPIKTESRIDVPNGNSSIRAGRISVAGVAWAQHKGIEAVEVRVDHGPWQSARLAAVPDIDTWRQWAWDWDATPGRHLIEARATDKTGYTQTAMQAPPEPNGATGYPSVTVGVTAG
jgi:DMSO/TMAO reductase YedYZ molybdopterin-dependent catalytic subunit